MRIYIKFITALICVVLITLFVAGCGINSNEDYNISNTSDNDNIPSKNKEPKFTEQIPQIKNNVSVGDIINYNDFVTVNVNDKNPIVQANYYPNRELTLTYETLSDSDEVFSETYYYTPDYPQGESRIMNYQRVTSDGVDVGNDFYAYKMGNVMRMLPSQLITLMPRGDWPWKDNDGDYSILPVHVSAQIGNLNFDDCAVSYRETTNEPGVVFITVHAPGIGRILTFTQRGQGDDAEVALTSRLVSLKEGNNGRPYSDEEAFEIFQNQRKLSSSPTPIETPIIEDVSPSDTNQNFANEDSAQILDENGEPAPIDYYAYYYQFEVGVIGLHFHGTGQIGIEVGDSRGSLALDEKGDGLRRYVGKWNDNEVLVIYQEDGDQIEFYAADGDLTKYNGQYILIEDYQP